MEQTSMFRPFTQVTRISKSFPLWAGVVSGHRRSITSSVNEKSGSPFFLSSTARRKSATLPKGKAVLLLSSSRFRWRGFGGIEVYSEDQFAEAGASWNFNLRVSLASWLRGSRQSTEDRLPVLMLQAEVKQVGGSVQKCGSLSIFAMELLLGRCRRDSEK